MDMVGKKKRPDQPAPGWGGRRPGSGRKAEVEGGRKLHLYVPAGDMELLRRLGGGNLSAGVRELLARAAQLPAEPEAPPAAGGVKSTLYIGQPEVDALTAIGGTSSAGLRELAARYRRASV